MAAKKKATKKAVKKKATKKSKPKKKVAPAVVDLPLGAMSVDAEQTEMDFGDDEDDGFEDDAEVGHC